MNNRKRTSPVLIVYTLLFFTITTLLWAVNHFGLVPIPQTVLFVCRWFVIVGLIGIGISRRSLTAWILISMVIGIEIGQDFPEVAVHLNILSQIFLKLIKTIIAPLLISTLVVGIAGHSNLRQVGRMGLKSIIYFEIVTTLALLIGLAAINISRAGEGIDLSGAAEMEMALATPAKQSLSDVILHTFPENIAKAIAEGAILQIVVFSILLGIGLAMVKEERRKPLLHVLESLADAMFKFTNVVMYFAPFGVGGAIAYTVGHSGLGVLVNLFQLLATLYAALVVFVLCVLLPIALLVRVPLKKFIMAVAEPVSIAFSTTSSEAALPRAMEEMEAIGVPNKIVAFVMPTGYSFNLDGTTLYLSLASVFVAQAAGIELTVMQQVIMALTLMLTSKGVAGIPRASLVILMGTAASFNLPIEPIFLIIGIDELMDMARTSVNVLGNCLATVVVARWEGEFDPDRVQKGAQAVLKTENPEFLS